MFALFYHNHMFDFLKNLSHNHQPAAPQLQQSNEFKGQSSSEDEEQHFHQESRVPDDSFSYASDPQPLRQPRRQLKQEPKRIARGDSIVGKMQKGGKAELDQEVASILKDMLQVSQKGLSKILLTKSEQTRMAKERKVYVREMSRDEGEYLQEAANSVQVQNYFLKQCLNNTIEGIIDQISSEIESNQLQGKIYKTNKKQEERNETLRLIRLREHQLNDKIGELHVELNNHPDLLQERAYEIIDHQGYNPESVKTRQAEEFIRIKQREREEMKMKMEEMKERKRQQQLRMKEEQQREAERLKKEKHDRLQAQFEQKQRIKKERQQKARTQQLHFKQFLKEYKIEKPLYKVKEQQFAKAMQEQKRERYHVLREKQAKYDPVTLETIQMHEQKYDQLRKEDRQRKQAQMQLKKQEEMLRKKQLNEKVYKGRFRYLILQELVDAQNKKKQKEAEKQAILMKKQAYSLEVKERHKPTIDPAKRNQLEQLVNSHKGRQRKYHTPNRVAYSEHYSTISSVAHPTYSEADADPKLEGKKYHRIFKQYIRDKIDKGQVRPDEPEKPDSIPYRPDYLKELRQKYQGRIPSMSTRLDRQIEHLKQGDDFRGLIVKAEEFENKAKQREVKLRNVPHRPDEEAKLEEDYLCAIKAKMSLLNNID